MSVRSEGTYMSILDMWNFAIVKLAIIVYTANFTCVHYGRSLRIQ